MSEQVANTQVRRADGTHRVVITGMGAVTPAGVGVPGAVGCRHGPSAAACAPITHFDASDYEVASRPRCPISTPRNMA